MKLPRHMYLSACRFLPSTLAGEASTSFRLISCVLRGLISMASLPSSEAATPPPSTVHSSVYQSSWDPLLLSETDARGSDEPPYHPMTFPRDGHLPSNDATGSAEFPTKSAVTEWGGVDEMGPWLRAKETDRLLLCDHTVHWSPDCPQVCSVKLTVVCMQFRLIAGEASTSFFAPLDTFLRCIQCSN